MMGIGAYRALISLSLHHFPRGEILYASTSSKSPTQEEFRIRIPALLHPPCSQKYIHRGCSHRACENRWYLHHPQSKLFHDPLSQLKWHQLYAELREKTVRPRINTMDHSR